MDWNSYFYAAASVLLASLLLWILLSLRKNRSARWFKPFHIFILGIFISSVFLFLPLYSQVYGGSASRHYVITASIVQALQLFTLNGERDALRFCYNDPPVQPGLVYAWLLSVEYLLAPLMAAGFIASFFKNFTASIAYGLRFFFPKYIFSELNEKSLALAESIRKNHRFVSVVFTDIAGNVDEGHVDHIAKAREMSAVCFQKNLLSIHFGAHWKKQNLYFFFISSDEDQNITQAVEIVKKYKNYCGNLYVFSTQVESDLILNAIQERGSLKIRRINMVQSLIYQELYTQAKRDCELTVYPWLKKNTIFSKAKELNAFENKQPITISAVLLGLGQHGMEMLKALSWYCQMDGYRLRINVFDKDPLASQKFKTACPELMDEEHNRKNTDSDDAYYDITVHDHVDVNTDCFNQQFSAIDDVSYVFICLGSDDLNIQTAVMIRTLLERISSRRGSKRAMPLIQAVVYQSEQVHLLKKITNYHNDPYDISFIGDVRSTYTEETIVHSDLENAAYNEHDLWASDKKDKDKFWKFDYYYRSSCTKVIHQMLRKAFYITGKDGESEEKQKRLEHIRWNAYMRSEGYIYSGSQNKASRSYMGKTHHDLVRYSFLSEDEKNKDTDSPKNTTHEKTGTSGDGK